MRDLKLGARAMVIFAVAFACMGNTSVAQQRPAATPINLVAGVGGPVSQLEPLGKLFGAESDCGRLYLPGCFRGQNYGLVHWIHGRDRGRHRQHGPLHHQARKL